MTSRFALLMILMLLIGCASASSTPTPISEVTRTAEPTATATKTPKPASTRRPTRTPIPTLTDTPAPPADSVESFLFQGTQYPNCELPCWHGLVIGESTLI